jgi:hypothetical protein
MRAVGVRGFHASLFKSKPGCCNSGLVAGEELELAKWGALSGVLRGAVEFKGSLRFNSVSAVESCFVDSLLSIASFGRMSSLISCASDLSRD